MKKLFIFVMLLFCFDIYAAPTTLNTYESGQRYLSDAADAWATVIGGIGTSGEIATYINNMHATDLARFRELISVIAYNDTAMTLYETKNHIDTSYSVIANPLNSRRNVCPWKVPNCGVEKQTLIVDGQVFASTADFDSDYNGDFKTNNTGVSIRAKGFVTDGFAFGVGYTRTMIDTKNNSVYTDATSNSITMFSQYLSKGGLFLNSGLNAGHTSWAADKSIAGIKNANTYDTDFVSGQINTGIVLHRNRISIIPQVGVRYFRLVSDKHIDAAAQSFEKWWYNTLTGMASIDLGYDFIAGGVVVRPTITLGGSFDAVSHGNSFTRVHVISGHIYDMPVESPSRAAFNGGLGITVYGENFSVGLNYRLDAQSDYMAHTGMLQLKIAF